VAIGPGKADLLDAIAQTGSISAAARQMRMSYRRAWILVDTMNTCFKQPLVDTSKGGAEGGGARLTPMGRKVLTRYRALAATVEKSFEPLL
jgi:molybdate transport system regulatory protein